MQKDSSPRWACQQDHVKTTFFSHEAAKPRRIHPDPIFASLCAFVSLCGSHYRHLGLWIGSYDKTSRYSIRKNKMAPHTLTSVSNLSWVIRRHILLAAQTASGRQAMATPIPARTSLR